MLLCTITPACNLNKKTSYKHLRQLTSLHHDRFSGGVMRGIQTLHKKKQPDPEKQKSQPSKNDKNNTLWQNVKCPKKQK